MHAAFLSVRVPSIALLLALASSFLLPSTAAAEKGPPLPPLPDAAERQLEYDWVQLETGEWLKGEIIRMHEDVLHFDSEEVDEQQIDWTDVAGLISAESQTVRLLGRKLHTGKVVMHDRKMRIVEAGQVTEAPRGTVVGIIPGKGREIDWWSAKASFGLAARAGNTEQMDLTLRADVRRQTVLTRFKLGYLGDISTVNNDTTANSHRVPASFDYYLTPRLFITTPSFEFLADQFQNLSARITLAALVGYEIMDRAWIEWEASAGAAYQYTSYISVATGDPSENDAAFILTTDIDFDLPRGIEWDNSYQIQPVATDFDKTSQHAESILSFDIWGPLDIDISFLFDRIRQPIPDADGDTPKSNDYRLTVGLALDL